MLWEVDIYPRPGQPAMEADAVAGAACGRGRSAADKEKP